MAEMKQRRTGMGREEAAAAPTISVLLKFSGKTIPLSISSDSTVRDLKFLLKPLTNVLPRAQKLIFKGNVLVDRMSLKSLRVSDGSKIMLLASHDLHHGDLEQAEVNAILTAVIQVMKHANHAPDARLAATRSLYKVLDFAQANFYNERERNYIMEVVCKTATSKVVEIRKVAFECLVAISSMYYEVLGQYMQKLFNLTANAVKGDEEVVALQAIEVWSSICDVEIEIQKENRGNQNDGGSSQHLRFIEKNLTLLIPILLEALFKEDDQGQDHDIWNLSKAGGTCLWIVAKTVGDAVVPLVMPFVEANIVNPDWRSRVAATSALGSILEGPSIVKLSSVVNTYLEFLLNAMKDENSRVKETTAWSLGRIFEKLHSPSSGFSVLTDTSLARVVAVLLDGVKDVPSVAEHVCSAIYFLADGFEKNGTSSSLLSSYFPDIISCLILTAERTDGNVSRLRVALYATLNGVVRCANIAEASLVIAQLLPAIMVKLAYTLEHHIVPSDVREMQGDLPGVFCSVLEVIIQKLTASNDTKPIILLFADPLMDLFLKVFACRNCMVHAEVMAAIGALAYSIGAEFAKYMQKFYYYLDMGLQNSEEYQVCAASVGVVGDICRALNEKVVPFCDGIMTHLLKNLTNSNLHQSVKPAIFCCIGDIALAINGKFDKYLPYTMPMLQGASDLCAEWDTCDEEIVHFFNQLRSSIFYAYSGILHGLKNSKAELMTPHAVHLLYFVEAVFKDKKRDKGVTFAAVGVIGDLAVTLGSYLHILLNDGTFHIDFVVDFLKECCKSDDDELKKTAIWGQVVIGCILVNEVKLIYEMCLTDW